MTRFFAVLAGAVLAGSAYADNKPNPTEFTSEVGKFTVTFPTKPSTTDDREQVATSAGNLSVVTSRDEYRGAYYAVTYTDYPASFGIVAEKDLFDGVVKGMKGSDGKISSSEDIVVGGAKGRSVTITAGESTVRAKLVLIDSWLYIVTVSGKKATAQGSEADTFLDSFTLTK